VLVAQLLARIALLPREMVREIVEFAHGDHVLESVVLSEEELEAIAAEKAEQIPESVAELAADY